MKILRIFVFGEYQKDEKGNGIEVMFKSLWILIKDFLKLKKLLNVELRRIIKFKYEIN